MTHADPAREGEFCVAMARTRWVARVQELRRLHGDELNLFDALFIKELQRRLNEGGRCAVLIPEELARLERIEREVGRGQ
jgi:hypothetical protein